MHADGETSYVKMNILFIHDDLQEWNDMNLRWNASEYAGVKDLRIPPHRIWKPDVLMYNRQVVFLYLSATFYRRITLTHLHHSPKNVIWERLCLSVFKVWVLFILFLGVESDINTVTVK